MSDARSASLPQQADNLHHELETLIKRVVEKTIANLAHVEEPDPCLTREHILADDPVKSKLSAFFAAVYQATGGQWFNAGELFKRFEGNEPDDELKDIILEVVPKASRISLGVFLKANENKIIGGLTLIARVNKHKKIREYKIKEPESGCG